MTASLFDTIPDHRRDAAAAAIAAAFGGRPLESLRPLTGGASAEAYRMEIGGRAYVLRLEAPRDRLRDPGRSYPCMIAAAETGIAPRLHHADATAGIAIMDYVEQQPIAAFAGGPAALAGALGELIGRAHALPPFPAFANYPSMVGMMFVFLKASTVFAQGLVAPHEEAFQRVVEAYRWDNTTLVSSHNDLNIRNVLFDGERLWLVDWELAFLNDPLCDLAIAADNLEAGPEMEAVLLEAGLGRTPQPVDQARLYLMRLITRMFYACTILNRRAMAGTGTADTDLSAPTPDEFRAMIGTGQLRIGDGETIYVFGKMLLAGVLAGARHARFEESLAVCRQG